MVANDAQSRLYGAVIDEVVDSLERQLSEMAFFQSEETRATVVDEAKMKFAPVTNLGYETEFAKLDVCIVASGGSTSVQTHSCKNIITTNSLLSDLSFRMLSDTEKRQKFKWAWCSDNVLQILGDRDKLLTDSQNVKPIGCHEKIWTQEEETGQGIATTRDLQVPPRTRDTNFCWQCQQLTGKEILSEISYLRVTIAPDIRQMWWVKVDGKFKMVRFSVEELRQSIRNAVKPESDLGADIDLPSNVL